MRTATVHLALRRIRTTRARLIASALLVAAACHDPSAPRATDAPGASAAPPSLDRATPTAAAAALQPWELENPATLREIEGFAAPASVNKGESLQLFVNTASPTYSVAVYRTGWYGGAGAELVYGPVTGIPGTVQPPPSASGSIP